MKGVGDIGIVLAKIFFIAKLKPHSNLDWRVLVGEGKAIKPLAFSSFLPMVV